MESRRLAYSAYFFDLGGTLVALENDEIARDAAGNVTVLRGVWDTLRPLHGQPIFVITNQAGVALGYLGEHQVRGYVEQLNAYLGGLITDYRICMHHPEAGCSCRKPRPGMVYDLAQHHTVTLARAILVGDSQSDAQCAHAAGIGTFVWADTFFGRSVGT
jgi:D-glycero-D-manno-heptose 1,7-bisphosphate phosphatase